MLKNFLNQRTNFQLCEETDKIEFNKLHAAIKPFPILHVDTVTLETVKYLTPIFKYAQTYPLKSAKSVAITKQLM